MKKGLFLFLASVMFILSSLPSETSGSIKYIDGVIGKALEFDGVDDYVNLGHSSNLLFKNGEGITITGWIKPYNSYGYSTIIGKPVPCASAGNYYVDAMSSYLRFCYSDSSLTRGSCAYISNTSLPLNQWTHFAVTYTFGQGSSFKAYINGQLTNSEKWYYGTGNDAPYTNPSHDVHIGHYAGCTGANYYFNGAIDELAVYKKILNQEEVSQHYQKNSADRPCDKHESNPVELTLVDDNVIGYATFQSYNQKVLANQYGIFMTYVKTSNEDYTSQYWKLLESTDGGKSFTSISEETVGTNPPVIETDATGKIYLMRQNYGGGSIEGGDSTLYVYDFTQGMFVFTIPGGNSGKYSMIYDSKRNRIYYFSHYGEFYIINSDGQVASHYPLITSGAYADPQYPLLAIDEEGIIYAAWTNQKKNEYMYWSIHFIRSLDGGLSWQKLDGTPLALPIACDNSGPADMIILSDEYNVHTWLWNFLPKNGKLHFAYAAQTTSGRQHYVRYDTQTAKEDKRIQPVWKGESVSLYSFDGFVVSDSSYPDRLFWVAKSNGKIGVLYSNDNGGTWYDYALSDFSGNPYSIGGFREVTADGYIIGSFTDIGSYGNKVYFFKIKAHKNSNLLTYLTFDEGTACECTSDSECNDGNSCTTDSCTNGNCQHTFKNSADCTCNSSLECDDSNSCTTDTCTNYKCVYSNNQETCNDNNTCTTNDKCSSGACIGTQKSCDDGDSCTSDTCTNGNCQHTFKNSADCTCNSNLECDDSNPCTNETCVNYKCIYSNNQETCNDNDPCTTNDKCNSGTCTGTQKSCDDGDSCTSDTCTNGNCQHTFKNSADCTCNSNLECDDSNPCTNETCVNYKCVYSNNQEVCNDNNPCTINDKCSSGTCTGTQKSCDDGGITTNIGEAPSEVHETPSAGSQEKEEAETKEKTQTDKTTTAKEVSQKTVSLCDGCMIGNNCIEIGVQKQETPDNLLYYCSPDYKAYTAKDIGDSCSADYECKSYLCSKGSCIEKLKEKGTNMVPVLIFIIIGGIILVVLFFLWKKRIKFKKIFEKYGTLEKEKEKKKTVWETSIQ